jgi:V8-like Glu-specific endopeptidase
MIKILIFTGALLVGLMSVFAKDNVGGVAYGEDNRISITEATPEIQELARGSAAMIPAESMAAAFFGLLYKVDNKKITESMNLCSGERFSEMINPAMCSAFLVADDLLVTAGHCIKSDADCARNRFVFDFRNDLLKQSSDVYINADNVYKCASIVSRALDQTTMNDYALIKLDRVVRDRSSLKLRKSGKIADNAAIFVIGQPSGLPSIISDQARVRSNDKEFFFVTNLDTFGGNSGSAVFNAQTLEVEGILVRGETDYIKDEARGCYVVNKCAQNACRGEDVTRLSSIIGL